MKNLLILSFGLLMGLTGCGPKVAIDKATLPKYDTLLVKEPTFNNTIFVDMDAEEKERFENLKQGLKITLQDSIYTASIEKKIFKEVSKDKTQNANPLTMECNFNKFEFGNRALRYFFWAGNRTKTGITCTLIGNNTVVRSKMEEDGTGGPFKWSSPESYFLSMTTEMAEKFAEMTEEYMSGE